MGTAIEVRGLVKAYGSSTVVDGVDLTIEEGEIVAFLGPNGAGKTTTIEILEGFRNRDAGSVSVLGEDPASAPLEWRERIGIVLQESEPFVELSALETIAMQAAYYAAPLDPVETLRIVGLSDSADQRTRKLSGGQRRRLDLATALVGDPELVFLDEPTTGFDPSARRESWDMIENLRRLGKTVLLTTHYMDEAEQLADRIVVISAGEIVARGTAEELADQIDATTRISWRPGADESPPPSALGFHLDGLDRMVLETDDVVAALHRLTTWATDAGIELRELNVARPTLEDVYLRLTDGTEP